MPNIEEFTGSVNISADITPITRTPIDQVTPTDWHKMSTVDLCNERIVLSNRMMMAYECGYVEIAKQVQKGIDNIDGILQSHKS